MPGACFSRMTGGLSPFRLCRDVSNSEQCFGTPDCLTRDWPVFDPNAPLHDWPFIGMGCIRSRGRMVPPPLTLRYEEGRSCGDVIQQEGHPTYGACCFERFSSRLVGLETVCLPTAEDECRQGWRPVVSNAISHLTGEFAACWYRQNFNETTEMIFSTLPGDTSPCAGVQPARETARSQYHDRHTLCQCSSTVRPFIDQALLDAGFTNCVRLPQGEEWEDACDMPLRDEFGCRALCFPLTFDSDGFAAFDADNRRINPDTEECDHVLADLLVDNDGIARSLACFLFDDAGRPTKVAVGNLNQGRTAGATCAGMCGEYRWDDTFDCD